VRIEAADGLLLRSGRFYAAGMETKRIIAERDALTDMVMPAVEALIMPDLDLRLLPYGVQLRLAVGTAVAMMLEHGLIETTPRGVWPAPMPMDVSPELVPPVRVGGHPPRLAGGAAGA